MIRLTEYSEQGGCGCKISLGNLKEILSFHTSRSSEITDYQTLEDCAISDMDDNYYSLHTLDFFSPIVDEPYLFGQISALNSISDIYAMGGTPEGALSILGWTKELALEQAREVLSGAENICRKEGIKIIGGHSIYNSQPIFGLSVYGKVEKSNIKRVVTNTPNCFIFLTKKIGTGILSTLLKRNELLDNEINDLKQNLLESNNIGRLIGQLPYVKAMTDVTGFGLGGHLHSICKNSKIDAEIKFENIPVIESAKSKFSNTRTSVTLENYKRISKDFSILKDNEINTLFDPQTNGGLLILVANNNKKSMTDFFKINQIEYSIIGRTLKSKNNSIKITIK